MNRFAFLLILFYSTASFAQTEYALGLNENGRDVFFEKSKLIAPVFKLHGDTIEGYLGFGVEHKKALPKYRVILPDLTGARDTGYSFLYSKVFDKTENGYTPVLIANYSRRANPAVIFVDHNYNFDFRDDGDPDTFYLNLSYIDIELRHPGSPDRKVVFRLSRFEFTKDLSFKQMADEMFAKHSGTKQFVGCDYSFREQRFNLRQGNFSIKTDAFQDSFCIALQDVNNNGLYTDAGVDRLLINPYGSDILNSDYAFILPKNGETAYFERGFKSYAITKIDSFGRAIHFRYDSSTIAKRQLIEGKKVPKIRFTDAKGETRKLRKYRRKPVYIYFWNREAPGFEEDTAALRVIHERFCPMITIIALNYGDNPKTLNSYVDVNQVRYLNGVATKAITRQFQLEQVPYGFLLKKRLVLQKKGLRPTEVLQMLENGEIEL